MRLVKALCCAAVLTVMVAPGARADEWNKKTILTFSGPVQLPGVTLAAGSYVFKLADIAGNRHVVQVFDKDEKTIYTTMLAIPNQRLEASDQSIVLFSERASGTPQAVKVWYYPGDRIGNEFVYPKSQAMQIARETHQSVLGMNDDTKTVNTPGEIPIEMKSAALGRFDESGAWRSDTDKVVVNTPAETAKAEPAHEPMMMANTQTTGTSGSRPARKHLPRTSSSLVLFELLSGFSLAGGFAVRQLRRHAR